MHIIIKMLIILSIISSFKVKVKVMRTSPPTFTDDRSYHVIKVHQGATATIRCQARGDPSPIVSWISPSRRVIPQSLGSGFYSGRIVAASDGTLEVRFAQNVDVGNYTCRASNSAGERIMVVGLEVEAFDHGQSGHVAGRGWSISNKPSNTKLRDNNINNAAVIQYGATGSQSSSNSTNSDNNGHFGRIRHVAPNTGINTENSNSKLALRSYSENEFNRPVSEITTQIGSSGISIGVAMNVATGTHRTEPIVESSVINSVANSHSRVSEKNPGSNNNEAAAEKDSNDNIGGDTARIIGVSPNVVDRNSLFNSGGSTGTLIGVGFRSNSNREVGNDKIRNRAGSSIPGVTVGNTAAKNSTSTHVGVVTTVKERVVKGHTVLLQCPSQGSPPPRLFWLLPGNGVLPAPYYGSRLTVHRNGSLELRGVRASDGGTLVCVVKGERGERRIQVELEVSEVQDEARSPQRAQAAERTVQKGDEEPRSGVDSSQSLTSQVVLSAVVNPRIPVTQKPLPKTISLLVAPRPIDLPPRSPGPVSEPTVSTRTASLVRIINGETLRLPCPPPQTPGYTQGSLSWTMPSGKVLYRGERSDQYQVQGDGTLTVQQASVFDRGTYTCRSTSFDSTSVSVITVPVIIIAYPPRITKGPSPVTYTRPGVAVELPCLTIATPQATVTWETPDLTQLKVMNQARIYGNHYLSPQGSLVIQRPTSRDTGFYRCTAKNVIGVDTKVTYLHVI